MERKWLNLTPHSVVILDNNGEVIKEFLPSGGTIRLAAKRGLLGHLDGVPILREELGSPVLEGLPEEELEKAHYVIVSSVVASSEEAVKWLLSKGIIGILVPTDFVRDKEGKIIGAKALKLEAGGISCPYCGHGIKKEAVEVEDEKTSFFCNNCGLSWTEIEVVCE